MIRVDLHSHSKASPDGGISSEEYARLIETNTLDLIAITDHDRIDFAVAMQKELGEEHIIVGEEITALDGEIIGLYLSTKVEPGQSAADTINAIHAQNGLVYIPHPFEKIRKGLQPNVLLKVVNDIDIIEVYNGRALSKKHSRSALSWSSKYKIASAASSDAHGFRGAGKTYTVIENQPERNNLVAELSIASHSHSRPPLRSYFYPKINRLKKKYRGIN